MTLKARLIRAAIKLTPPWIIRLTANMILRDIAELKYFHFDLDTRKVYVEVLLAGEPESIEVWAEDFFMLTESGHLTVVLGQARANRLWLTNIFRHVTGRSWQLPIPPQYASYAALIAEVFQPISLPALPVRVDAP
jgi:hypothetical protein